MSERLVDHLHCRVCRRTVGDRFDFEKHLRDVHDVDHGRAAEFTREKLRRYRRIELEVRVGQRMGDWTLDTFPAADVTGRRALRTARDWIENGPGGLLIFGPVGTGKTGLAVGILRALIDAYPLDDVDFVNVRAFLAAQRERISAGEQPDTERLLDRDTIIVLDDLGAERPTDWALETIARIVEARHVQEGATIVTSNYAPSALARRLGRDDPVIGQRIVSRLVDGAVKIKLDRADLRARSAAA